jgi:small-conductance mechanosensitive channel
MSGRITVAVSVPFTADSRRVEVILREIAEAQPLAILNPAPVVALMGFGPEVMNFEIRLMIRDIYFQVPVRSEINQQIAERFKAEGIVFSNQHRDYLKRIADEAAAEAEALAEEQANLDAVAAFLAPEPARKSRRPKADKEAK